MPRSVGLRPDELQRRIAVVDVFHTTVKAELGKKRKSVKNKTRWQPGTGEDKRKVEKLEGHIDPTVTHRAGELFDTNSGTEQCVRLRQTMDTIVSSAWSNSRRRYAAP